MDPARLSSNCRALSNSYESSGAMIPVINGVASRRSGRKEPRGWTRNLQTMIVDGYVRVSQLNGREGESFISPLVQRDRIADWAAARGATVANVFEELEESGARADRPLLMEAIARIESRLTDGVVVASLDRFGRSLVDGLAAIDRIQSAGGSFVAVEDGFNLSTDTGQLILRIMLSIAEWELDRLRSQWSTARERAIQRGVYMGPRPPVGYLRRPDGRLVPDSRTAPAVVETFRRRASGATLRELADNLTARGVHARGACWRPGTIGKIIRNRVYVGELRSGSFVNRAAHKPIIDDALWDAAQTSKRVVSKGQARRPTILGGLLRCAGCGHALSTRTTMSEAGTPYRIYSCNGEAASGACRSRVSILSRVVEPYIDAAYFGLLWAADKHASAHPRLRELLARLTTACAETARYRDSPRALRALGAQRFAQGIAKRVAREQRLRLALDAERARLGIAGKINAEQLEATWPNLSISERKREMSAQIDAIFVVRGRGRPENRIIVCGRGEGPNDLPQRGRIGSPTERFHVAGLRTSCTADTAVVPSWPASRVKSELIAFLATQPGKGWPADDQFVHAGQGPLLRQLERTGGTPYWHREVGSEAKLPALRYHYWTDANIAATLSVLLKGRGGIPSGGELTRLGYTGLPAAIARRGATYWLSAIARETSPEQGGDCGGRAEEAPALAVQNAERFS